MATKKSRPPAGVIRVDFSKVKDGGRVRVPEGDYVVKIKGVKQETSQAGNPMLVWTFTGVDGKLKGRDIIDRTTLTEKSLWKLRDLLEAAGIKVPKRTVDIPIKKLAGKELGVTLLDDEYEGRISSKVADYVSPDAIGDEEPEDDDETEDDEDAVDFDEMDRTELKAYIKENELDVTVKKSMTDDDLREAVKEAAGSDEEEEEEDEDEDEDDDELAELDRASLKAHIKSNNLDVKVKKSMTDDDIRAAIREASDDEDSDEDSLEDLDLGDL